MYKVSWTKSGGFDGWFSYTEEKVTNSISELIELLCEIQDEKDINIETINNK